MSYNSSRYNVKYERFALNYFPESAVAQCKIRTSEMSGHFTSENFAKIPASLHKTNGKSDYSLLQLRTEQKVNDNPCARWVICEVHDSGGLQRLEGSLSQVVRIFQAVKYPVKALCMDSSKL